MELEGTVTEGMGRGADYVGRDAYQERFEDVLGYRPFPGTLNLQVDTDKRDLFEMLADQHEIAPFEQDGERLSAVTITPIKIEHVNAALITMEITDHPDSIAEIIARINLRDALGLQDGDTVTCRLRDRR